MKPMLVYMTAANRREAEKIGQALVEERLAACVNILGPIRSMYWWEGKVQKGQEVAFIAKTPKTQVKRLIARVKALHSYECPCVVAVPIEEGFPGFLKWIEAETRKK
jgi:periplasmic divalent cation tolerance protein